MYVFPIQEMKRQAGVEVNEEEELDYTEEEEDNGSLADNLQVFCCSHVCFHLTVTPLSDIFQQGSSESRPVSCSGSRSGESCVQGPDGAPCRTPC